MVRNPNLVHRRWRFPQGCHDGHGRMLESIIVREIDSIDTRQAAISADGNKETNFMREVARMAIVAYRFVGEASDVKVDLPFPEFDDWTNRSVEFALRKYQQLNSISEAEAEGEGEAVDATTLAMLA